MHMAKHSHTRLKTKIKGKNAGSGTAKPPEEATSDRGVVSPWTAVSLGRGEISFVSTATNKSSRMTNWSA